MKWKNKEKYKNSSEIEKGDFSRIFIFILASDNTSKKIIIIKTKQEQKHYSYWWNHHILYITKIKYKNRIKQHYDARI